MEIVYNGTRIETNFRTIHSFLNINSLVDSPDRKVLIVNGFQTDLNLTINDGDEIFMIDKGILPPQDQLEMMMAARHTPKVHAALKDGSVAIAGLGGLGSNIAVSLARIGVGRLLLVDFDVVEPSNLNRQSYLIRHLGMYKTEALKSQLEEVNPFIKVRTKTVRINEDNATRLFKDYDIVCEAFDSPSTKAMLINELLEHLPDIKIVSASGMAGYESSNLIRTERRMKKLYLCGDFQNEANFGCGLMAPRVQICAGHQANMILRLLLGNESV